MKRILVTGFTSHQNGIVTTMLGLHRHIDRDRIQFDYLLTEPQKALPDEYSHKAEIEKLGGRVFFADYDRHSFSENARSEIRRIIETEPDIAGVHMCTINLDDIFPVMYAYDNKLPICTLHCHAGVPRGEESPYKDAWKTTREAISGDGFIRLACSDLAGIRLYGDMPFTVLPNAVETQRFDWNPVYRQTMRRALGISDDTPVLGYLGVVFDVKNPKYTIRVFKEFKKMHQDAVLLMVGAGRELQGVMDLAKEMDVYSSVIFTGEQIQPEMFYHAMDCLLMPSFSEGMPNVAIEAQVSGLPCLISDRVTEMVKLTPCLNFLSIEDEAEEWARAADRVIEEKERRSYAEEIRIQGFDIREIAENLTEIYCARL